MYKSSPLKSERKLLTEARNTMRQNILFNLSPVSGIFTVLGGKKLDFFKSILDLSYSGI